MNDNTSNPPKETTEPRSEQPLADGSNPVDDDVPVMLEEAKLTPAGEINVEEESAVMVMKRTQYKRILWWAMVLYAMAVICNIVSFVLFFINPPPAAGRLYAPFLNGLAYAAILLFIATILIFLPTMRCCSSTVSLEEYAPDDKGLLRDAQIASAASVCLFAFVATPIIVKLPDLQWLGYAFMTCFFAGTVFALLRVQLLRRSKETRQKKPKVVWVIFAAFFFALCGVTIWLCLNPTYPDCNVEYASWIGDGECDGPAYHGEECGYDDGDCLSFLETYPNCSVEYPMWINDGYCDGGPYAREECGFDGGDCLKLGEPCSLDSECASAWCSADTKVCDLGVLGN